MGDYFKEHPDAIGAIFSVIATYIMNYFSVLDGALLAAPASGGYLFALAISRHLLKKAKQETTQDYEKRLLRMKQSKYTTLEKITTLNSKNGSQHGEINDLLKKTTEDINRLEEMEMEDLMERKKEINDSKSALKENSNKFAGEIRKTFK